MPYLRLGRKVELTDRAPENAGDLTYLLQQETRRYLEHHGLGYHTLAEVLGAIEGLKLDIHARLLAPYEERKRVANGDVWPGAWTR